MKKLVIVTLLMLAASTAFGDHLDVIAVKLRPECSFPEYLAIVQEFNEWGQAYGYRTEIAYPLHGPDVSTLMWIGRSANAETFGKAWDAWRDAQADPSSTPARLNARFEECNEPLEQRMSFDTYP